MGKDEGIENGPSKSTSHLSTADSRSDGSQPTLKTLFDDEKLEKAGITWDELVAIHDEHRGRSKELLDAGNLVAENLRAIDEVHSLKVRVKDPVHLIQKIVRKNLEGREITASNYKELVTDLVGIRALHLFKDEWVRIHARIRDIWNEHERPTANIRDGDPDIDYRENGCDVKKHPANYRSVHYLVKFQPTKNPVVAEIQVRTIFEEGWCEIDHRLRYPNNVDNPILSHFLSVFNRLAGSADEMGSFINHLMKELEVKEADYYRQRIQHDAEMAELIKSLEELKKKTSKTSEENKRLQQAIDALQKRQAPPAALPASLSHMSHDDESASLHGIAGHHTFGVSQFPTLPKIDFGVPQLTFKSSCLDSNISSLFRLATRTCRTCGKEYSEPGGIPTHLWNAKYACPHCHSTL